MVKGEGKEEAVEGLQSSTEQMERAEGDTAVCAPAPRLWPEFSTDQASTSAAAGGVSTQVCTQSTLAKYTREPNLLALTHSVLLV